MPRNNIAKRCKFIIFDSYSALPMLLFFLHMSWMTFWILVITCTGLFLLERKGMTLPMLLRYLRRLIAGPHRLNRPWWRK